MSGKKINRCPGEASTPWLDRKTLIKFSWWTAGLAALLFILGLLIAIFPENKNTPSFIQPPIVLGPAADEWHVDERRPQIGQEIIIPISTVPTPWVEVPSGINIDYSNWIQIQLKYKNQTNSEFFWDGPGVLTGPFKKWNLIRFLNTGERNNNNDVVASIRPYR